MKKSGCQWHFEAVQVAAFIEGLLFAEAVFYFIVEEIRFVNFVLFSNVMHK